MRRPSLGAPCVAFLVGIATTAAGCGPIEYIAVVPANAAGAIAEAKHVGADKYAIYEITAAQEYIHKSRVLAGYARFQSSVTFGRKAGENARKAKTLSLEKARLPKAPAVPETNDASSPAATETVKPVEVHFDQPMKVLIVPDAQTDKATK